MTIPPAVRHPAQPAVWSSTRVQLLSQSERNHRGDAILAASDQGPRLSRFRHFIAHSCLSRGMMPTGYRHGILLPTDLWMCIADPHRVGHERSYYPGCVNFRAADVIIINKANTAEPVCLTLCG